MGYIGVIGYIYIYMGYIGIMEKKMETTGVIGVIGLGWKLGISIIGYIGDILG